MSCTVDHARLIRIVLPVNIMLKYVFLVVASFAVPLSTFFVYQEARRGNVPQPLIRPLERAEVRCGFADCCAEAFLFWTNRLQKALLVRDALNVQL